MDEMPRPQPTRPGRPQASAAAVTGAYFAVVFTGVGCGSTMGGAWGNGGMHTGACTCTNTMRAFAPHSQHPAAIIITQLNPPHAAGLSQVAAKGSEVGVEDGDGGWKGELGSLAPLQVPQR